MGNILCPLGATYDNNMRGPAMSENNKSESSNGLSIVGFIQEIKIDKNFKRRR